jgi:CYTH domain-containing protein
LILYNDLTKGGIEKKRYKMPFKNKLWEIDEFLGDNQGLIIAEIELDREDEEFEKPDWVTLEVTDDNRYLNSNLATCPYKSWSS